MTEKITSINFVASDEKQKQFGLAVRKNVNEYFRRRGLSIKGNAELHLQTVAMLALYFIPFILLLTLPAGFGLSLILWFISGIGLAGIGMCVMHDAVHGAYSEKTWVNKLFGGTMYLLGSNVFNWKVQHNIMHHAYTNVEGFDRDIASRGPIRLSTFAPLKKIHKYQYIHAFFFYGFMTISKLVNDFSQLAEFNRAAITRKFNINPSIEYVKMLVVKILYLGLFIGLPVILTPLLWWQVVVGFFIMHWTAGCILSTIFQMAHVVEGAEQVLPDKSGNIACDWVLHELRATSDFARDNLFLNWYIGGLNFQIEHHLFPQICHIHYRKISPIVEKTAHEFGYEYNLKPSFINALESHVKKLKELGNPPAVEQPIRAGQLTISKKPAMGPKAGTYEDQNQ